MKLKFLGSGSSEGIPALFCRCKMCTEARKKHRYYTRSQLLVDNELLVDFPPDSYDRALHAGVDLADIRHVIVTHSHSDHFYPEDFFMRGLASSHGLSFPLTVYGNGKVTELLASLAGAVSAERYTGERSADFCGMEIYPHSTVYRTVKGYEIFHAGAYEVTALPSVHMATEESFVYAVRCGDKSFLYATDTAPLTDEVYRFLARGKYVFDCVIYDGTYGCLDFDEGHMNFCDCEKMRDTLAALRLLDRNCRHVVTHVSHNAAPTLTALYRSVPKGFSVARDGYEIVL